jgi:PKD repeat protein
MLSRQLRRFFGFGSCVSKRAELRRVMLDVEGLEARQLLSLTPIATPISFTEGPGWGGVVGEFSDSTGNTNPSVYGTVTTSWGDNGSDTPNVTSLGGGLFAINDMHTAAPGSIIEAGTYTVTSTVGGITITSQATVADAPLSSSGLLIGPQATAGVLFSGNLGTYTDPSGGPSTDLSGVANWGDGTAPTAVTLSNGQVTGSHLYQQSGTFAISITINDVGGSTTSFGDSMTVAASNSGDTVSLTNPGPQTGTVGAGVTLQLTAVSSQAYPIQSYGATGLPPGLTLNPQTGQITGMPTTAGSYAVSAWATDSNGITSPSQGFSWTVNQSGTDQVTLANPGPQTSTVGARGALQLAAVSSQGYAISSYGATGLPPGLTLNPQTGAITGVPTTAGSYAVTAWAADSDAMISTSQTFTWTVNPSGTDQVTLTNPGPQTGTVGAGVTLPLQASSSLGYAILDYTAGGLPGGLTLNPQTGVISGVPALTGSYLVSVSATDATNVTGSQSFLWTINPGSGTVSFLNPPGPQTGTEGQPVSLQVPATDSTGAALSYSGTGLPPGLDIDPNSGAISGTIDPGAAVNSPYQTTITATDPDGNSASTTFAWSVNPSDTVTLTNPWSETNNIGEEVTLQLQASSSQGYEITGYDVLGLPAGLSLNPQTGAITGVPTTAGSYTITAWATDTAGTTSAIQFFTWTISDYVPPTVTLNPAQTIYAGGTAQFNASITDAAGPANITLVQWDFNYDGITFNPDPTANNNLTPSQVYSTPGTYLVAVQATDQTGAVTTALTEVIVKTTDALLVNAGPDQNATAGVAVAFAGSYSDPGGTVSSSGIAWDFDYDGGTFMPMSTGSLTPSDTFTTPGTYQVALQVTDSNRASDLSVLNVVVSPPSHVGPTATAGPDQTTSEGTFTSFSGSYTDPDGTVAPGGIAWDFDYDGSDFNPMITGTLMPSYTFDTPGDYQVALQVTDSNGLSNLGVLNLTVTDVPPVISAGPNRTVTAGAVVNFAGSDLGMGGMSGTDSYQWDFNDEGTTFNPGAADTLTPQDVFTTPGTYTVALQATDPYGGVSLSTLTVTVNPAPALVVSAGPDQEVAEGDSATFAGSWTDSSGIVDPSSAQWDFDYNGTTFTPDPSAAGTLTPSYTFTTPGTYEVALRLTDSNNVTALGLLYVSVGDIAPDGSAGSDLTVAQGTPVTFSGTASDAGGSSVPLSIAWDFDYDGTNFNPDPAGSGTLTPTYTFTPPGTYEVALQVSDPWGGVSLTTLTATVTDVAPTATVTNSGPTPEGSPVTFTVANLVDQTPGETPTFWVDWTGSGQFEELTSDAVSNNGSSYTFQHVYDTGTYNAVVEIMDGSGGATDYAQAITVTDVAPTASFGPSGGAYQVTSTTPFLFTNVYDPSYAETTAGFTYYMSVDGGPYTSSSAPSFLLPAGLSDGTHTVSGYLADQHGDASPVYTDSIDLVDPEVTVSNSGDGQLNLTWVGSPDDGVTVGANTSYTINGPADGLTITLLTPDASDAVATNGTISALGAAAGVTGFSLSVNTATALLGPAVGDGSIGQITLPAGTAAQPVTLAVDDRGDLGSITGPSGLTSTSIDAGLVNFADLTGSITGLDEIETLTASGWLGTSLAQQVTVNDGIGSLSAYGIGATVTADQRSDDGDVAMQLNVGDGGVPGVFNAGVVANALINGNVNVFTALSLLGNFTDPFGTANLLSFLAVANTTALIVPETGLLYLGGKTNTLNNITAKGDLNALLVAGSLTVQKNITAFNLRNILVAGNLSTGGSITTGGDIGLVAVGGETDINGSIQGNDIGALVFGGTTSVDNEVRSQKDIGTIAVLGLGASLSASIYAGTVGQTGNVGSILVNGDFKKGAGSQRQFVYATGSIGNITVMGNIGKLGNRGPLPDTSIEGSSIGTITVAKNINIANITATDGNIVAVTAGGKDTQGAPKTGTIYAAIMAVGGDIRSVTANRIEGNLVAKATVTPGPVVVATGGNIWNVIAGEALPVQIVAQVSIGTIRVTSGGVDIGTAITAQSGATFNPVTVVGTPGALVLNLNPTSTFLGSVTFAVPPRVPAVQFSDGTGLLSLTDWKHPNGSSWSVHKGGGTANSVTITSPIVFKFNKPPTGLQPSWKFSDNNWTVEED